MEALPACLQRVPGALPGPGSPSARLPMDGVWHVPLPQVRVAFCILAWRTDLSLMSHPFGSDRAVLSQGTGSIQRWGRHGWGGLWRAHGGATQTTVSAPRVGHTDAPEGWRWGFPSLQTWLAAPLGGVSPGPFPEGQAGQL